MKKGAKLIVKSVRGDRIRVHHISGYLSLLGDEYGTFTYKPESLKFIERKPSKRRDTKND